MKRFSPLPLFARASYVVHTRACYGTDIKLRRFSYARERERNVRLYIVCALRERGVNPRIIVSFTIVFNFVGFSCAERTFPATRACMSKLRSPTGIKRMLLEHENCFITLRGRLTFTLD